MGGPQLKGLGCYIANTEEMNWVVPGGGLVKVASEVVAEIYALELSGAHIGKAIEVEWRFPSWAKSKPNGKKKVVMQSVEHRRNGNVHFNRESGWDKFYVPFDATVKVLG